MRVEGMQDDTSVGQIAGRLTVREAAIDIPRRSSSRASALVVATATCVLGLQGEPRTQSREERAEH